MSSRDLLYNLVPIVNIILYTYSIKRLDLTLSILLSPSLSLSHSLSSSNRTMARFIRRVS